MLSHSAILLLIVLPLFKWIFPLENRDRLYGGSVKIRSIDESGNLCIKSRLFSLKSLYVVELVLNNYSSCANFSAFFNNVSSLTSESGRNTRISFGVQSKAVQMLSTLSRAMYCPFFIFEIILAEILAALISWECDISRSISMCCYSVPSEWYMYYRKRKVGAYYEKWN